MTRMKIALTLALAATGLTVVTAQPATAASTASLGAVTCADAQGGFEISVTADDGATSDGVDFSYRLVQDVFDGDTYREDMKNVAAGASATFEISDLDDGSYDVYVDANQLGPDETFDEVLQETIVVGCDPAPEGPYTNPRATTRDSCSGVLTLLASNRAIGGNTADLQPVTFVATMTQGGVATPVAEFTLPDEDDDPTTHSVDIDLHPFGYTDGDGGTDGGTDGIGPDDGGDDPVGEEDLRASEDDLVLSVTANGTEVLHESVVFCIVVAEAAGGGGPAVVNTGA